MPLDAYTRRKLMVAPVFLLVCLIVLEASVRLLSHVDSDGNRWFKGARLKPYGLPVRRMTELIHGYETSRATHQLVYDRDIGWVPDSSWNLVRRDSAQSTRRVRIAVFGASYTDGWWRSLKDSLEAAGVPAEVVSFGCGGYGTDQAFLSWRKRGASYRSDIVLFGFSRLDCENNLNLVRMLAEPETGIPFVKPRFLRVGERLQLINVPTPPLDEVPGVVAHFGGWRFAAQEHYFHPTDFETRFWRRSVLLSFLEARIAAAGERKASAEFYDEQGEGAKLTLGIVKQFRQETEAAGSRFFVVHLPHEDDLRSLQETGACPFPGILAGVSRVAPVIRPEAAMLESARGQDLSRYFGNGHYTKEFNSVIARILVRTLVASPDSVLFRRAVRST